MVEQTEIYRAFELIPLFKDRNRGLINAKTILKKNQ